MARLRGALGRWLFPALLPLLLGLPLAAQALTDRYDPTFRKYSKRFFGVGFDWRLFKAQGMTESNLNPAATSWVGARGVMQLMPTTFRLRTQAIVISRYTNHSARAVCSMRGVSFSFLTGPGASAL